MNKYAVEARHRRRSLLIVEGKHEKESLFGLLFECFPELDIRKEDVWIYGTNIYRLYDDIVKEYGEEWTRDGSDVDLPFVISKKEQLETVHYKDDFTNIMLVFDYERHDPQYSESKITEMQEYFCDMADIGKLYLNYPMIEAYQHLKEIPDAEYAERKVPVSLQPGTKYKNLVKKESAVEKSVEFPNRIEDLLSEGKYKISDLALRARCRKAILDISSLEQEKELETALLGIEDEKTRTTLKYQLKNWIEKMNYTQFQESYWSYMRKIFQQIIRHNLCKANRIENGEYFLQEEQMKTYFHQMDLTKILRIQNETSRDEKTGFIWVLSTCMFVIPDYNFKLV